MSNEQPHDPTVTLRLEMGRITDQRDAFKAAFRKEVLEVAKTAIYHAMLAADAGGLRKELEDLKAENARLKVEVERLNDAIIAGLAIIKDAREVQP